MTVFPALVQLRVQLGEVYRVLYPHVDMMFFPQLAEFKNNSIQYMRMQKADQMKPFQPV